MWTVAAAEAAGIEDFFGRYKGSAAVADDAGRHTRDLEVAIAPRKEGFNVTWTTISYKENDRTTTKTYSIDFERTGVKSIYQSAMRTDMFGNKVPLNPLKGEPFVWATLYGDTLTVYALLISEEGEYELQQYERTLTPEGLELVFRRLREGEETRFIKTLLKRIEG